MICGSNYSNFLQSRSFLEQKSMRTWFMDSNTFLWGCVQSQACSVKDHSSWRVGWEHTFEHAVPTVMDTCSNNDRVSAPTPLADDSSHSFHFLPLLTGLWHTLEGDDLQVCPPLIPPVHTFSSEQAVHLRACRGTDWRSAEPLRDLSVGTHCPATLWTDDSQVVSPFHEP